MGKRQDGCLKDGVQAEEANWPNPRQAEKEEDKGHDDT